MGPVQWVGQSQWGNPLAGCVGRHNQRANAAIANTTPNVTATEAPPQAQKVACVCCFKYGNRQLSGWRLP